METGGAGGAGGEGEIANSIEMVRVQGGTFLMGATEEQGNDYHDDEIPAHNVAVGDFYIGKYAVTQRLWTEIMGANPSEFRGDDNLPVENVSWHDAHAFILALNGKTGGKYRLPTEAEWEYAARGGRSSRGYRYSGSNNIDDVAWCVDNSDWKTHPVGAKLPNELGIYDMSGNVWEWVSDRYGAYGDVKQVDPAGPRSGPYRVFRGGSWRYVAHGCRVSGRYYNLPGYRYNIMGFRLAMSASYRDMTKIWRAQGR